MKNHKLGLPILLLLILLAGAASVFYTMHRLGNQNIDADYAQELERIEKAKGETITLTETKNGSRKWVIKMKEIKYRKDNNIALLTDVKGLVYGANDEVLFTFSAPNGEYVKTPSQITLTEGAKMISPKAKVIMRAPHMQWSADHNMVNAQGGVEMAKEGFGTSKAQKAIFAMDFSKIEFIGNARSIIGSHTNTGAPQ